MTILPKLTAPPKPLRTSHGIKTTTARFSQNRSLPEVPFSVTTNPLVHCVTPDVAHIVLGPALEPVIETKGCVLEDMAGREKVRVGNLPRLTPFPQLPDPNIHNAPLSVAEIDTLDGVSQSDSGDWEKVGRIPLVPTDTPSPAR